LDSFEYRLTAILKLPRSYSVAEKKIDDQDQKKKAANAAAYTGPTVVEASTAAEEKQNYQYNQNCAHGNPFICSRRLRGEFARLEVST
jgi:hypothetical protein